MTTTEQTRIAEVDPLVLTAAVRPGQRLAMIAVDVLLPLALVAIAVALPALGMPGLGWVAWICAAVLVVSALAGLARSGRTPGAVAAGTRIVDRTTGAAAGASAIPALFTGRLSVFDLRRGRDPFAPALAPLTFPDPVPSAVPTPASLQGTAPTVELDSGQRLPLGAALVLGRRPTAPADAPAEVYQWTDLTRTLSKSHARLEWDGSIVWVTDLGSTNGTSLRTTSGSQPLLPFQRTPLPADVVLALGDRVITVRSTS
jgi:hypothetical protein